MGSTILRAMKKTNKDNSYTEYTYTDGEVEVMLHHRVTDDKILAVYTYAKDAPSFNQYEDSKGRPMTPFTWEPGLNPLFVHLKKGQIPRFVREFIDSELVCVEREETE